MLNLFSHSLINLRRQKTFTIVNILGFSLGLASAISIFLYVFDELTYDNFHEHARNVGRVTTENRFSAESFTTPYTPVILAESLRDNDRSLTAARLFTREVQLSVGEKDPVKETDFAFADPDIINVFTFRFITGNPRTALQETQSVILSKRAAIALFGSVQAAVGAHVLMENRLLLQVTGVFEDWPPQSHLRLNVVANFENYLNLETQPIRDYLRSDWIFTPVSTYVKTPGDLVPADVERAVNTIRMKLGDARAKEGVYYHVQPLKDIHLYSAFTSDGSSRQIVYVYIFALIGLVIMFMACTNFINLSLATSIRRFKEISIRKVLGGNQRSIIFQILGESLLYVFISLLLAMVILYLVLPYLNSITRKELSFDLLSVPLFLGVLVAVIAITGLVAGLIPAIRIARVNAANGIKGQLDNRNLRRMSSIRLIVVTQFVVASVLLIFTININRQMRYFSEKSMGFQKEQMIVIPLFMENLNSIFGGVDGELRQRMTTFENELLRQTSVEAVTLSSSLPGESTIFALVKSDRLRSEDNVFVSAISVDYDFVDTYRIPIKYGRNFSKESGTDHIDAYIINEKAIRTLGYRSGEEAVGKEIDIRGKKGRIVGIVQDFNFQGLQEVIRPLVLDVSVAQFTAFSIRANPLQPFEKTIAEITRTWQRVFPERYFEYSFLDANIDENYRSQYKLLEVIEIFSAVAILISALGLFGLGAYTSNFYLKEISIRKLSGATTIAIISLLLRRQLKIGFVALIVGFPAGYWISESWLEGFAYHVDTTWSVFLLTYAGLSIVLALATLYHIVKTSKVNPLQVIKSE